MLKPVLLVLLVACGSDPPTCNQATDHFYIAGCRYLDEQTQKPLTEPGALSLCESWQTRAKASAGREECGDEFTALLNCEAGVPIGATGAACCSATYTDLVNCLPI